MNSVNLVGRLTRDPELKNLPNGGTTICRFSLAVDKGISRDKKQEMESKGQNTADFINITVWGKQAENCANYLAKGRQVAIQGRIQTGSYNADDGSKRYTFEVVGERINFIDWGDNATKNSSNHTPNGFQSIDDDDEMPF